MSRGKPIKQKLNEQLLSAAEQGNINKFDSLIKQGGKIEAKDKNGITALMIAASRGHAGIVTLLLGKGGKIEAADKNGVTALMIAASIGHAEIVRLLLGKGANIEAADKNGYTALMLAAQNGHVAVVTLLLQKNAKIEATDKNGGTTLMIAASRGHAGIVQLLLEENAKIEATDKNSFTALMIAASIGHAEIVRLLLGKGAKIEAKDKNGITALIIAAQNGHVAVVTLLLENGANPNVALGIINRQLMPLNLSLSHSHFLLSHPELYHNNHDLNNLYFALCELGNSIANTKTAPNRDIRNEIMSFLLPREFKIDKISKAYEVRRSMVNNAIEKKEDLSMKMVNFATQVADNISDKIENLLNNSTPSLFVKKDKPQLNFEGIHSAIRKSLLDLFKKYHEPHQSPSNISNDTQKLYDEFVTTLTNNEGFYRLFSVQYCGKLYKMLNDPSIQNNMQQSIKSAFDTCLLSSMSQALTKFKEKQTSAMQIEEIGDDEKTVESKQGVKRRREPEVINPKQEKREEENKPRAAKKHRCYSALSSLTMGENETWADNVQKRASASQSAPSPSP
jgi:ankyrin repeat protein